MPALLVCLWSLAGVAAADVESLEFRSGDRVLALEVLEDRLLHFRWGSGPQGGTPIPVSPYVDPERYPGRYAGPSRFQSDAGGFSTAAAAVGVDSRSLALELREGQQVVLRLTPAGRGMLIEGPAAHHLYGLGEQFLEERFGNANGGWLGRVRTPGVEGLGNAMVGYHGGAVGNAQFPMLYGLCQPGPSFLVFMDDPYVQKWDFQGAPWRFETAAPELRGFVALGPGLKDLRERAMHLVGRPPVPPQAAFGLWVSEFGFDDWDELLGKLETLRREHFPVDGFVLDLQWFGGIRTGSEQSSMGRVAFDESRFPDPRGMIDRLRTKEGVGLITIEEAYISKGLPEHKDLARRGFLARRTDRPLSDPDALEADAHYINENPWWGLGGMLDFTNPAAGRYWHDLKRQKLVDLGILGHWTDLGEPEMFRHKTPQGQVLLPFYFEGKSQAEIHNLYAFSWARGIFDAYRAHHVEQRPMILTRTGAPGIQRFGAALWSGDIGSNFGSLAAHSNAQMHMSLSGIDFFGADVGGFHRAGLQGGESDLDELYSQWFADACAFDVPLRPHTENVSNTKETAPDRVGYARSNLANVRLRYRLIPYYYSLAHRAHRFGEAVVAPLAYHFADLPADPSEPDPFTLGEVKMIGPYLLSGMVAKHGATRMDVYLPPGDWVDYHALTWHRSSGASLKDRPLYRDGKLQLPLFLRAGAVVPQRYVDEETMNSSGRRRDGTARDELIVRVVPSEGPTEFTLYEDDGRTPAYLQGQLAETLIQQKPVPGGAQVRVEPARGTYPGAPEARVCQIELVLPEGTRLRSVELQGQPLAELDRGDRQEPGYYRAGALVTARSARLPTTAPRVFEFRWE